MPDAKAAGLTFWRILGNVPRVAGKHFVRQINVFNGRHDSRAFPVLYFAEKGE